MSTDKQPRAMIRKKDRFTDTLNKQLPRPYDDNVDFILPQHGLLDYPPREYVEIRIPLPPREVEVNNGAFGTTDIHPKYAVSYMDKIYYEEYVKNGKIGAYIAEHQKRWYRKLGIKTAHEKAIDVEIERLNELRKSLPEDSIYE